MTMLSAVVPILIFCSLGCISARNVQVSKFDAEKWLDDITFEEVENQCKLKDKYETFYELKRSYYSELTKFLHPNEHEDIAEYEFTLHYIYNTNMIEALKNLMKVIQDCLDEEKRLDPEGIVTVMDRILKAYSMKVAAVGPLSQDDFDCFNSQSNAENIFCRGLYPRNLEDSKDNMLKLLMLGSTNNSTCEQNLPFVKCIIKEYKDCTSKARKLLKVSMSPAEIAICNNYPEEVDPEIKEIGDQNSEGISDLFKREEKSFSLKNLLFL